MWSSAAPIIWRIRANAVIEIVLAAMIHLSIIIQKQNEHIVMLIKDDGRGFDTAVKKYGIGLENINRRVKLLDVL